MTGPGEAGARVRLAPGYLRPAIVLRDAALVVLLGAGIALASNALRPSRRIALVASQPYEVLVPCPEHKGTASPLSPAEARALGPGDVLVDARSAEEHRAWHPPGALWVPFDYLEPVSREGLGRVLSRRPRRVIVLGDGDNPDSGEQLARQLAGKGIKNVFFVAGGAPALRGGSRGTP